MKKLLALILASLIMSSAVACSSGDSVNKDDTKSTKPTAQTETTAETEAEVKPAVITATTPEAKEAMEKLERQGHIGVAYVMKDGKVLATYSKGMLEKDKPITIDTPMPLGSVSKQFCASAIFLLQEQGKLSIDDTLDKYYPDYKHGKKITLKHMLSMRSGIPEYTLSTDLADKIVEENKSTEETLITLRDWMLEQELDFQPDEQFYYSNSNYHLLSYIVEQVSGQKYIDFLRENFFEPLGMTHTGSVCELESYPQWAQGSLYAKEEPLYFLASIGDGDIIATCADMMLWMDGLRSGKVISPESYKAMTTNYSDTNNYGYGLEVNLLDGVGHSGLTDVYTSMEYINDYNDILLFMASNSGFEGCDYGVFSDLILNLT